MTRLEALKIAHKIQRRLLHADQALEISELTEEEKNMPVSQEVADLISGFDSATDKVAARIQRLIDKSPSLSAEEKALLQGEVDKLNLMGQDPANPLPPPVV